MHWADTSHIYKVNMWQLCVEIEGYSVAHFDLITVFEAPHRRTSVKDGAHEYHEP